MYCIIKKLPHFFEEDYIVKLSKNVIAGYNTLYRLDSLNLLGSIEGNQTKFMLGELMLELCIKDKSALSVDGGTSSTTQEDLIDGGIL